MAKATYCSPEVTSLAHSSEGVISDVSLVVATKDRVFSVDF